MDLRKRGTEYHPVDLQDHAEQEEHIELTVLPKSGTSSHVFSAKQGRYAKDDDMMSLVHDAHLPFGWDITPKQILPWIQSKRSKLQGWRFGVCRSAWLAASTLVFNTLITIVAVTKFGSEDGIGTAYMGSCSRANLIATCLHIFINVLSSVLLGASNYTMQALVAPTRAEVDHAHSKGAGMDIGVPSIRNLLKIRWYRTVLWAILALSSVPIHLLYNSAVFKSVDNNLYIAIVANPTWLEASNFSTDVNWTDIHVHDWAAITVDKPKLFEVQKFFHENLYNTSLVSNLSNLECVSNYSSPFLSGRQNVIAITNERGNSTDETMFYARPNRTDLSWACDANLEAWLSDEGHSGPSCSPRIVAQSGDWQINGKTIEYCLSQLTPQHCTVQFSVHILIVVICMNAAKTIGMFIAAYGLKNTTLVTVGDAVASYLGKPDKDTAGHCLTSRKDISAWRPRGGKEPLPKAYRHYRGSRWFAAASNTRWITCFTLIAATIIAAGLLLRMGASSIKYFGGSPWGLGWGAISNDATFFYQGYGLLVVVLIANAPQALVSFLYLLYNGLLTSLLLANEWSTYAFQRKGLRVTTRNGAHQRSTYYLQLPLRYSIPLLGISATLHWIISQSLFLVREIEYFDGLALPGASGIGSSRIGFSPPPILTAMIIGFLMLAFAIGLGFRKLGKMPVAGSCSVAISAACHRPEEDVDAALLPVQWGEVQGTKVGIGHACFTSQVVTPLIPGRLYA